MAFKNLNKKRARQNAWRKAKRRSRRGGEVREADRRYRARKAETVVHQLPQDWEANQLLFQRYRCHWCHAPIGGLTQERGQTRVDFDADHIIPLDAGGEHSESNMVLACIGCNMRRGGSRNGAGLQPASQDDTVL